MKAGVTRDPVTKDRRYGWMILKICAIQHTVSLVTVNNWSCATGKGRVRDDGNRNRDIKMAFFSVLFLSVMYLTTVKAQTFCEDFTNSGISCFSAPSDCNSDDCEMTMIAVDNNSTFTITLTGKSDGWVALGFSSDQLMGNDDVIMCIYNDSEVTLQHRYNQANVKNNVAGTEDFGDYLVLLEESYLQGVINCTFNRTKSINGVQQAFGLVGRTWYGLFGTGPVTSRGEPSIHNEFPWYSQSQIDLASGELIVGSRRSGNPTPTASPPTSSPGDAVSVTTKTSAGVRINPASVTGIFEVLLVCILFSLY